MGNVNKRVKKQSLTYMGASSEIAMYRNLLHDSYVEYEKDNPDIFNEIALYKSESDKIQDLL